MRILHIATSFAPKWGGVYRAVVDMAKVLNPKVDLALFTTSREGIRAIEKLDGIKQICTDARGQLEFSFEVKKALETHVPRYDVIHIHGLWQFPLSYAAHLAKRLRIPYVYQVYGMLDPWPLSQRTWQKQIYASICERKNLNGASAIICVMPEEKTYVQRFGVSAPVRIIPNGFNPQFLNKVPPRGQSRKRFGIGDNETVILFIGRIHPKKGIELLIEAFAKIPAAKTSARLVIAGPEEDKVYAERLRARAKELLVPERVLFVGPVFGDEKESLFADSDIFGFSTRDEACSLALLEAMGHGLPAVVTHESYFHEVETERAGIMTAYEAGAFSKALETLVNEPGKRVEMGKNAKRLILERYTWEKIGNNLIQLYEDVFNQKVPATR